MTSKTTGTDADQLSVSTEQGVVPQMRTDSDAPTAGEELLGIEELALPLPLLRRRSGVYTRRLRIPILEKFPFSPAGVEMDEDAGRGPDVHRGRGAERCRQRAADAGTPADDPRPPALPLRHGRAARRRRRPRSHHDGQRCHPGWAVRQAPHVDRPGEAHGDRHLQGQDLLPRRDLLVAAPDAGRGGSESHAAHLAADRHRQVLRRTRPDGDPSLRVRAQPLPGGELRVRHRLGCHLRHLLQHGIASEPAGHPARRDAHHRERLRAHGHQGDAIGRHDRPHRGSRREHAVVRRRDARRDAGELVEVGQHPAVGPVGPLRPPARDRPQPRRHHVRRHRHSAAAGHGHLQRVLRRQRARGRPGAGGLGPPDAVLDRHARDRPRVQPGPLVAEVARDRLGSPGWTRSRPAAT